MDPFSAPDCLHRLVKQSIDSGAAASVAEAEALFRGYRLVFAIGPEEASDPMQQAALLTGVALARRVFLGGVSVTGPLGSKLTIPMPLGATLAEAVSALGGLPTTMPPTGPRVTIGGGQQAEAESFHVRTMSAGWRGGIVPCHKETVLAPARSNPLAAMLAAAFAVNDAFSFVSGGSGIAGRRSVGLSLWDPSSDCDWRLPDEREPDLQFLPSRLWLIGLGHLGQAFLWGLGLLPYRVPSELHLMLQDVDRITPSSESTSILTDSDALGQKKTRAMAAWAERRGFTTSICERVFDSAFRRQASEPGLALCGVDNALARRALDQAGFDLVIEAGLGRGFRDFRSMRLHTLPGPRSSDELWKASDDRVENVENRAAYQKLLSEGSLDRCGVTLLAGKAVGAPFVGAVAACLALSDVLRLLHGGPLHQVIDLDLQSVEHRQAIVRNYEFRSANPGYAMAEHAR